MYFGVWLLRGYWDRTRLPKSSSLVGGVIGLTIARRWRAGVRQVTLIERGRAGRGSVVGRRRHLARRWRSMTRRLFSARLCQRDLYPELPHR